MVILEILWLLVSIIPSCLACSANFSSPSGSLSSPGYPWINYPRNKNCYTTITAPENVQLVLTFTYFVTEWARSCDRDYVEIYPVPTSSGIVRYCGVIIPGPVISQANTITIHFVSDASTGYRGFNLLWKRTDTLVYHDQPLTWFEAAAECSREGAALARNDGFTRIQITNLADKSKISETWVDSYFTPWVWLKGCLRVEADAEIAKITHFKHNQMRVCLNHCSTSNYFALQHDQCICLDGFEGEFVTPNLHCTILCPGNVGEMCGGTNHYNVYMNDMCFNNTQEWTGSVSQTIGGKTCDPWSDHYNASRDHAFPDGSISNASNYCRDPDNTGALWCYSGGHTHHCDVPKCFAKGNPGGTSFPCIEFELDRGIVSAQQVDCSSAEKSYLAIEIEKHYTQPPVDCYKMTLKDGKPEDTVTTCKNKAPFICQHAVVTCGESFTSDNGTIYSPNYPQNYYISLNCVWRVNFTSGHYVSLQVEMDIEPSYACRHDFITVYDGDRRGDLELGTWCGNDNFTVNSTGNQVVINFRTDESRNNKGFKAEWIAVPIPTPPTITMVTTQETPPQDVDQKSDTGRMGSTDDSNSVALYVVIAVSAAVILLIVVVVFLVRRYKARKTEKATATDMQVHCTKTSGNNPELVVTNYASTGYGGSATADAVYYNANVDTSDELYINCDAADATNIANSVKQPVADPVYGKVNKSRDPENKNNRVVDEDADVYDHTDSSQKLEHGSRSCNKTLENLHGDIYDHTSDVNNAAAAIPNDEQTPRATENLYDHTGTLPANVRPALEDDTYSSLNDSTTEEDTYDRTLPRTVVRKDDTYDTFDKSYDEHVYGNPGALGKAQYTDSTYNTCSNSIHTD